MNLRQHLHKRNLIIFFIISLISAVGVTILAVYLFTNPSGNISSDAQEKALKVLVDQTKQVTSRTISSDFNYSLTYNPDSIDATGIVRGDSTNSQTFSGETFTGDELAKRRAYIMVELTVKNDLSLKEKSPSTQKFSISSPIARFYTNKSDNYFDRSALPEGSRSLSDLELLLKAKISQFKDGGLSLSSSDITIDNIKYKLLKIKKDLKVGNEVVATTYQYEYMTSQNNRPYWFSIINVRENDNEQLYRFEQLLRSIRYGERKTSKSTSDEGRASAPVAAPQGINNYHGQVDVGTLVTVVARNQIATVRIGTIRCSNLGYKAQNGATFTLKDACSGGIGSGSFISGDGYIATNGHVADDIPKQSLFIDGLSSDEEWQSYYDFIVKAGYISRPELDNLIQQAMTNEDDYLKLMSIIKLVPDQSVSIDQDENRYVIQTSNDPIRIDTSGSRWSWKYTPTNVTATLVDSEVDKNGQGLNINDSRTDVAILKADGSFPNVTMASVSVREGDQLTAIGYPASVDGGTSTKLEHTVPTVSQGYINTIQQAGGNHKVFVTTAEIAPGNSGGPAFGKTGEQIGLNTYSIGSSCNSQGDASSCFGRGIARDIKDIKDMMSKNKITAKNGELTVLWNKGMNEFLSGYYSKAAKTFATLQTQYPSNYLVESFATVAAQQPTDKPSSTNDGEFTQKYSYADDGTIILNGQINPIGPALFLIIIGIGSFIAIAIVIGIIIFALTRKKPTEAPPIPPLSVPITLPNSIPSQYPNLQNQRLETSPPPLQPTAIAIQPQAPPPLEQDQAISNNVTATKTLE